MGIVNPLITFSPEELNKHAFKVKFDMTAPKCIVYDNRITECTAAIEIVSLGDNPNAVLSRGFTYDTCNGYMILYASMNGSSNGVVVKLTN